MVMTAEYPTLDGRHLQAIPLLHSVTQANPGMPKRYAVLAAFDINGIHTIIKIITAMINMIQIHFRFAFWCFFAPSSCLIPFSM